MSRKKILLLVTVAILLSITLLIFATKNDTDSDQSTTESQSVSAKSTTDLETQRREIASIQETPMAFYDTYRADDLPDNWKYNPEGNTDSVLATFQGPDECRMLIDKIANSENQSEIEIMDSQITEFIEDQGYQVTIDTVEFVAIVDGLEMPKTAIKYTKVKNQDTTYSLYAYFSDPNINEYYSLSAECADGASEQSLADSFEIFTAIDFSSSNN